MRRQCGGTAALSSRNMKNMALFCICLLFSVQTYGAGKWRERIYRFLPFIAPKAYKLEKREKARLDKTVTSLSDRELLALDTELKNNTEGINTLEQMRQRAKQEIHRRILQNGQNEILEASVPPLTTWPNNLLNNEKTAPQFFEFFQNAARSYLPEKYKDILRDFILANGKKIMALNPTHEQLKVLSKAIRSFDFPINILQETLDGGKNARQFLTAFDTIAWPSPSDEYRKALDTFFKDNAGAIAELSFSPKQTKRITRYVKKRSTYTVLLKSALKQAGRDAGKFFAIFDVIARMGDSSISYKYVLENFFSDHAEALAELSFSPQQTRRIINHIDQRSTTIVLLESALKQARGDADKFFAIFDALTWGNPSGIFRDILDDIFTGHAEELAELSFSPQQARRILGYIHRASTHTVLLKGALKQAGRKCRQVFCHLRCPRQEHIQ